ncbi:MAG: metallophosphoesterase [Porcipelethomonas sp.]
MNIIICILLLFFLFAVYVWAENKLLIVRRYKTKLNIPHGKKLKIVHISDIHKKKYPHDWKAATKKIKALEPDVIFITGDLVSRTETRFEYTGVLIKRLSEICPVYCSKGNHEIDLSKENFEKYRNMLTESGGILLENSCCEFEKDDIKLNIYGADLKKSVYKNNNGSYSNLENYTAEELEQIFGKPEHISVLLAHNPFFFNQYSRWGADITFSGHVHGGAVNTPFGGLLSPERKFFPKYTKGIYEKNGCKMVVSTGIGKLRIFNPSEILYIEAESQN